MCEIETNLTDGLIERPSAKPGDIIRDGKNKLLLSFCVAAAVNELLNLFELFELP